MIFINNFTYDYEMLINSRATTGGDVQDVLLRPTSITFFSNKTINVHVEREGMFVYAFASCKIDYPSANILKKHLNKIYTR
jgi:hypothetical protein